MIAFFSWIFFKLILKFFCISLVDLMHFSTKFVKLMLLFCCKVYLKLFVDEQDTFISCYFRLRQSKLMKILLYMFSLVIFAKVKWSIWLQAVLNDLNFLFMFHLSLLSSTIHKAHTLKSTHSFIERDDFSQ